MSKIKKTYVSHPSVNRNAMPIQDGFFGYRYNHAELIMQAIDFANKYFPKTSIYV